MKRIIAATITLIAMTASMMADRLTLVPDLSQEQGSSPIEVAGQGTGTCYAS